MIAPARFPIEPLVTSRPELSIGTPDRFGERRPLGFAVNAGRSYWFGRRLWLSGLGHAAQGLALLTAGGFLLTQMFSMPNLLTQTALVAVLLVIGGLAMLYRAQGDFGASITFDFVNVRVRSAWHGHAFSWSQVERWCISEDRPPLATSPVVSFWLAGQSTPITLTAREVDETTRREICQWFRRIAYRREA